MVHIQNMMQIKKNTQYRYPWMHLGFGSMNNPMPNIEGPES